MESSFTIPAQLVEHLRRGLLVAMGSSAERLADLTLPGALTHEDAYDTALWMIEAARIVLKHVGLSAPIPERDVLLDEDSHLVLVLRVLQVRHEAESARSEDARAEGLEHLRDNSEALESVVEALKRHISRLHYADREAALIGPVSGGRLRDPPGPPSPRRRRSHG